MYYSLSTLHRTLVALTALHLHLGSKNQVLHLHQVTEDDLSRHRAEWERLQALREAAIAPRVGHPLPESDARR
jgi:hypothetical protein